MMMDASTSTEIRSSTASTIGSDRMNIVEHPDHVRPAPDLLDIKRAALCSASTYQEASWCESELQEYSSVGLSRVLMGERNNLHNLVLGIAYNSTSSSSTRPHHHQQEVNEQPVLAAGDLCYTLFIAFRGSKTLADWLVNLDTRQKSLSGMQGLFGGSVPGQFHAGFYRRLKEIFPDMHRLRNYIREEGIRRLVFCGHSLGGALAHMALISFMITTGVDEPSCNHLSIAFGCPHFCDAEAQNYLSNEDLGARMFTYIHNDDPIPLLLNSMRHTKATVKKYLVELALSGLHMNNWFAPTSVRESRSSTSTRPYKVEFAAVWIALLTTLQNANRAPRYAPVGRHYLLGRANGDPPVLLDIGYHSTQEVVVNRSTLQHHNAGAYLRSLQVRCIDRRQHQDRPQCGPNVQILGPHIMSSVVEFTGRHEVKKRAKIIVRGDNLFLPLGFNISSTDWRSWRANKKLRWKIANEGESRKLVLNLETEADPSVIALLTEAGAWPRGGLSVSVTTCFGTSNQSQVIAKDPWFGSSIKCVLRRCICKLLLMKRCGLFPEYAGRESMADLSSITDQRFDLDCVTGEFHQKMTMIWEGTVDPLIQEFTEHRNVPPTESVLSSLLPRCCSESQSESAKTYKDSLILLLQTLTNEREEAGKEAWVYERKIYALLKQQGPGSATIEGQLHGKERRIFKVFSAHEHLENVKTVAFVGPRFAGKSTLINSLAEREVAGRSSSQQSPEVESFMMTVQGQRRNVVLVEVPGAGHREKRWQDLQHVADLVVVVVSFAGETEDHAEMFAEEARRLGLCDNVILVVNGMDRILHGQQEASLWERYHRSNLEDLRLNYACRARVPAGDVLMGIAFGPENLEPNTRSRLEEREVIMFRDDITSSLRSRISLLHTTTTPQLNYPFITAIRGAAPPPHEL